MLVAKNTARGKANIFTEQVFREKNISPLLSAMHSRIYGNDKESQCIKLGETPYWISCRAVEDRVKKTLAPLVGRIGEGEILEVGCAAGISTSEIAKLFPKSRITAIDVRPDALEIAKKECEFLVKKGRAAFRVADGYNLEETLGKKMFDAILVLNNVLMVMAAFSDKELARIMENFTGRLKSGGRLLLSLDETFILHRKGWNGMELVDRHVHFSCMQSDITRACRTIEKK